jgi:serine/threonine protein kinase
LKIATAIALAMRHVHSQDVIHCNLKPEAILVNQDWSVTLSGFEYSISVNSVCGTNDLWKAIGSCYLAPECYEGRFVRKSDVFSFGLILYLLIVGRRPFQEKMEQLGVARRIGVDDERPDIPESVPGAIEGLIRDCWETDPEDRPSFDAILSRLELMHFSLSADVNSVKMVRFVQTIEALEEGKVATRNDFQGGAAHSQSPASPQQGSSRP